MTPEEKEKLLDQPVDMNNLGRPSLDALLGDLKKDGEQVAATSDADKDDEGKVPASRFRKTRQELIELRERDAERTAREADIFNELARLRQEVAKGPRNDALPSKWVELYGDTDQSKVAYQLYQEQIKEMLDSQRQASESDRQQQARLEAEGRAAVADSIDDGIEELEVSTGKTFTDAEKEALLDVVERYSPENDDGTFNALIPLDRAYQIYEMEQASKNGGAAKRRVAEIASAATEGEGGGAVSRPNTVPSWDTVGKRWGL